jgi:hypothetical protein
MVSLSKEFDTLQGFHHQGGIWILKKTILIFVSFYLKNQEKVEHFFSSRQGIFSLFITYVSSFLVLIILRIHMRYLGIDVYMYFSSCLEYMKKLFSSFIS